MTRRRARSEPTDLEICTGMRCEEDMLKTDWVLKAEFQIEAIRMAAQEELYAIDREFAHWQKDDARRAVIMRLSSILFVPVVSLYTMRVHMADPMWWEQYGKGSGNLLAEYGRTSFDKGIRGKLILDLAANLEHSFGLILRQFDAGNKASKFWHVCESLFRTSEPYLSSIPFEWESTFKLLRLIRNTVHTSWTYWPDNGKSETVVFKDRTFEFVIGKPLDFISWDLLVDLCQSVLTIATVVVRDANVARLAKVKDFGVEEVRQPAHVNQLSPGS